MCPHAIDCDFLLTAQLLTPPKDLSVSAEGGMENFGVSKMNIEWKDGLPNSIKPDKVTYDIEISYTEQQKLVHNVSRC